MDTHNPSAREEDYCEFKSQPGLQGNRAKSYLYPPKKTKLSLQTKLSTNNSSDTTDIYLYAFCPQLQGKPVIKLQHIINDPKTEQWHA